MLRPIQVIACAIGLGFTTSGCEARDLSSRERFSGESAQVANAAKRNHGLSNVEIAYRSACGLPVVEFAHGLVRMNLLGKCSLVTFTFSGGGADRHIGIASEPRSGGAPMVIGEILPEGGMPEIVGALVRNVDEDPERELLVLVSWEIRHPGLATHGKYFRTYVFDQARKGKGSGLVRLARVEKRIGEGFSGVQEGHPVTFEVTSLDAVQRMLGPE